MKFTTPIRNSMAFDVAYNRFRSDNAFLPQPEVNLGDIARFDSVTSVQSVAYTPGTCTVGVCDGYYTTPLFREQVTHQPEHCQEPPRPEGRLRVRGHHPRYAHLADLAVPGELSERAADEREHLHAAGGGLDRSAREHRQPVLVSRPRAWRLHSGQVGADSRRVVVNLGLRYETNRSWQPASCAPKSDFFARRLLRAR